MFKKERGLLRRARLQRVGVKLLVCIKGNWVNTKFQTLLFISGSFGIKEELSRFLKNEKEALERRPHGQLLPVGLFVCIIHTWNWMSRFWMTLIMLVAIGSKKYFFPKPFDVYLLTQNWCQVLMTCFQLSPFFLENFLSRHHHQQFPLSPFLNPRKFQQ